LSTISRPTFSSFSLDLILSHPPRSTIFPYTTLFRSSSEYAGPDMTDFGRRAQKDEEFAVLYKEQMEIFRKRILEDASFAEKYGEDRKSTRLNSSHVKISYAVFCLNKKTTTI